MNKEMQQMTVHISMCHPLYVCVKNYSVHLEYIKIKMKIASFPIGVWKEGVGDDSRGIKK